MTMLSWSQNTLADLTKKARDIHSVATIVAHRGHTVLSDGDVTTPYIVHSIRKSFASALFGIAVERGEIDLNATLASLGIDDIPALTAEERRATIGDLLAARSGVFLPSAIDEQRPARGSAAPGTAWHYNNWDFNVLGVIYELQTRKNIFVALDHYLAKPLGFEDWDLFRHSFSDRVADPGMGGMFYPTYRMAASTRDLAKFGQLYLQNGQWNGRQLVPEHWVTQSTRPISRTNRNRLVGSYGFLWWVVEDEPSGTGDVPVGTFSAVGFGGNYVTVIPSLDLVVVVRVNTKMMETPEPQTREDWARLQRGFKPISIGDYSDFLRLVIANRPDA